MSLKLMYITNRPDVAQIAEAAGVDRIFVDMEYIGKFERQGGMDTVQSHHTIADIAEVRKAITKAELMVRVNPIHQATDNYGSSEEEINAAIEAGADVLMLPFFKTVDEVRTFIKLVGGRAKTFPLLETPEAVEVIDEILELDGLHEIHIGLNDLSLGYGRKFMFELLSDGTVEKLCNKFQAKGIPYGFGGIGGIGKGALPAEYVIREHYRLGSTRAILSRSFCDVKKVRNLGEVATTFVNGVREIRELEAECQMHMNYFTENQKFVVQTVAGIVASK